MIKLTMDLHHVTPMNRLQIEHLARVAGEFESQILLEHQNRVINGKSMLGLLSLGVTGNQPVNITFDGVDEEEALRAVKKLLESGVIAPKSAADAERLMQRVKQRYQDILGENLVGIYLHGSLAAGCFRWDRSDIDFLVVVRESPAVEKKIALVETLYALQEEAPLAGFEMSVVLEKDCRNLRYPIPFDLHASKRYRADYERDARGFCERMHGEDPDLTAHILCLHAFGRVLWGPSISRVFDPVRREDALSAIRYDANDAGEHFQAHPCYYVLNLCRALAYYRENLVLSKREGGEWALQHLDQEHQRVIQAALNAYQSGRDMSYDAGLAENFCYDALEELNR
ncbi:MAG: DUF4111 domain-containing protein [Clostridia bacterium]|nr:DUF4111 domain-containing protein [Clostridia bacterium]